MRATKILIVGDEPNILRTLRRNLIERGYEVYVAFDDEEADTLNEQLNPDLFVLNLDFTLLEVDGLKICEKLRQVSQSPMIVLSSIGSETIKVRALDLGADDYLVMPFNMEEFLARVRVALRRWLRYKAGPGKEEKIILVRDLLINLDFARSDLARGPDPPHTHRVRPAHLPGSENRESDDSPRAASGRLGRRLR